MTSADSRAEAAIPPPGHADVVAGGGAEVDRLLAGIHKRQRTPLHEMPLAAARSAYAAATTLLDIAVAPGIDVAIHPLDSHPQAQVRTHQPAAHVAARQVLVWVHGGGFCLGSAATTEALCRWFSDRLAAVVVSVEYRLAPEHSVAHAIADVAEAVAWAKRRHADLPLCVLGDSAGATLALLAHAQAAEAGPACAHSLVLCYPLVLATGSTTSRQRYASGHYLTMDDIAWMHAHAGLDRDASPLAPLLEPRWPAMPRTLVVLAHRDPLFDEGQALAHRLRHAGTTVSELHLPELVHGCLHMAGIVPTVRTMHERIAAFLAA